MTTIYAQFSDSTDTEIISVFGCPQDPAYFPNQGEVDSSDARYKKFFDLLHDVGMDGGLPVPASG